ncbi:photosynthetic complex putative assembly protein PuhB [Roseomonas sp. CCTCC AB2023176]|uniref:photosynthetic complex putative assembly protein PuhB n=1 Tax=Roseomonas sp. CCTCC AB2023176 TaxID=3342640 RepID=UPI0035D810BB
MNAVVHPRLDTTNPLSRKAPIREHEGEPVRGLPERLPAGETILWQGAPEAGRLARRAFHLRGIAIYFLVLAAWRGVVLWPEGAAAAATGVALMLALGAVPIAILALLARLSARTTLYTVTDQRLVMRVGIALPLTIHIPFSAIGSASARVEADGSGDVVLSVMAPHRASYVALWPHARPWRFGRPEPMLRCIPDAATVAGLLSRALAAQAEQPVPAMPVSDAAPAGARQPVTA